VPLFNNRVVAIEHILKAAIEGGASDVHIKAGDVVRVRVDGRLLTFTKRALSADQTRLLALNFLATEEERATIDTLQDYDCAWESPGVGRFRVNILRHHAGISIVLRVIQEQIPTLESLKLPPVLERIAQAERGMVLVTGVTGSGKSSTMAAMVHAINDAHEKHILTLENPIEHVHRDLKGSVTQREVGMDTESFRIGLRSALRQDPDVILIGEMRDTETIETAMKAAETGHLMISTLHTADAQSTIMRIVAMFRPDEQVVARRRLAESLHAVVSQRLLPRANGTGRVVACEVMIVTAMIRDLIADGRVDEIRDYINDGAQYGMQTFDQHLTELVNSREVTFAVAKAAATNPADFALSFRIGANRALAITPTTSSAPVEEDAPDGDALSGLSRGGLYLS
jgi:twitching motility protein PilT